MLHTNRSYYKWLVLAAGTLSVFSALGLARFGYSVLLPSMQKAMQFDNSAAGMLASANLAGYLFMALIGGALASHFGSRVIIVIGLITLSVAMIMTGFSTSYLEAAFWRSLTGIGSGAANVAVMGLWAAWFPASQRGLAAGIAVNGSAIAFITTGIFVPPLLADPAGWQFCWKIFGIISIAIAVIAAFIIRTTPQHPSINLSSPYGITPPAEAEKKEGWHDIFRSKIAWKLGSVYVAFGFSYIIFMTFFVKHLMISGSYSKGEAGKLFMAMGWANLLFSFLFGAISDKIGRGNTLVIVYLIHASAFTIFGMANSSIFFTISAIMFGMTAFSVPAIMAASCGDVFGKSNVSTALGFVTLLFGIGQVAGPAVAGFMADRSGSFTSSYILAAVAALLGAAGSFALRGDLAQNKQ